MTKLRFRKEAEADLEQILAYYREVAAEAVSNIQAYIAHGLSRLLEFPRIGAPVEAVLSANWSRCVIASRLPI